MSDHERKPDVDIDDILTTSDTALDHEALLSDLTALTSDDYYQTQLEAPMIGDGIFANNHKKKKKKEETKEAESSSIGVPRKRKRRKKRKGNPPISERNSNRRISSLPIFFGIRLALSIPSKESTMSLPAKRERVEERPRTPRIW